jgi:sulfofructose kinase
VVAVTAGAKGCWFAESKSPDHVEHQAAFPVQVIDTTGCGDVFHGAYAAALAQGHALRERFRIAAAAAALKATAPGGQAGTPNQLQLTEFLRQSGA